MSDKLLNKNISHVIFDLDGTLIDTEQWGLDNLNTILKPYGKRVSRQTYAKLIGLDAFIRAGHIIKDLDIDSTDKEFFMTWVTECRKNINDIKLMPGVDRLIEHLNKHNIPFAIGTTGKGAETIAKINHLPIFETGKYFQHIVNGDDDGIKRLKPFPDVFQVCVSQFTPTPDPQNVLVFEDNPIGIAAAVAANMQSVLVNDLRFAKYVDSDANVVINTLEDFKPEVFGLPPFI